MRKTLRLVLQLMLFFGVFTACQDNIEQGAFITDLTQGQSFSLSISDYSDAIKTKAVVPTTISLMKVGIYNKAGRLVNNLEITSSEEYKKYRIEGLPDGDYTAVFMGLASKEGNNRLPSITVPEELGGSWLPEIVEGKPHNEEYIYGKQTFSIENGIGSTLPIVLNRIVGRVEIVSLLNTDWVISKIKISFDDNALYGDHSLMNEFIGSAKLVDYDVRSSTVFYSLPTIGNKSQSGVVSVEYLKNGKTEIANFTFNLCIEANKRARLLITEKVDVEQYGFIKIWDSQRTSSTSRKFFQDGDSYKSVAARRFRPDASLSLQFDHMRNKMIASFYSALPVRGITVLVKRPSDTEFFELAWFESMQAFEEREIDIPSNMNRRLFRTETGGYIMVDSISNNNLRYKYKGEEPLIKELSSIEWPCEIRFSEPTADTLQTKKRYLPLRPVHAREAVVLYTNMGYIISQADWTNRLLGSEKTKPFTDNGKVVSLEREVFPRLFLDEERNHLNLFILNPNHKDNYGVSGMSYVGNGGMFAMAQDRYLDQYRREGALTTIYHEFGHVMGYNHDGNMTYGEWQDVCANHHYNKYKSKETPFYTEKHLNSASNSNLYK